MRVDGLEVQLAGDEGDDGPGGGQPSKAASPALGGLEQPIDGLQEAVGLAGTVAGSRLGKPSTAATTASGAAKCTMCPAPATIAGKFAWLPSRRDCLV